jgi:sterol desaturase/sphingolipid hydroxylase (fatty acid hydroxylase superfamily)
MFEFLLNLFHDTHARFFEACVLPLIRVLDQTAFTSEAFNATEMFLLGVIEISLLYCLVRPLEKWRPAESVESPQDRRTDIFYTVLHRLGGFALISFALLTPLLDALESQLRLIGVSRFQLDQIPTLSSSPLLLWVAYLVTLDFAGYWFHRLQHRAHWWWQLHSLHHANTHMSLWSDNRNHMLDDLLLDILLGVLAWFIGVEPAQYVMLVMVTRFLQSLQHANVRLNFAWLGERLLVSPYFHRVHHAVTSGYEGSAYGCNFGVIFPWWDVLFGTAKYNAPLEATGVRDAAQGRDYGQTFWSQQSLGVLRLLGKA